MIYFSEYRVQGRIGFSLVSCHNTAAARATQTTHEWPMDQHSTASSERVHARTDAPDPQTDREEDSWITGRRGAHRLPPLPLTAPPTARSGTRRAYPHRPPLLRSPLPPACALASVCVVRAEFVARPPPPAPRRQLAHSLRAGEAAWRRRHWLQRLRDAVEEGSHRAQGGAQVLLEEEPSALPSL